MFCIFPAISPTTCFHIGSYGEGITSFLLFRCFSDFWKSRGMSPSSENSVILTDKHNKKTIQVSPIKGTYIHFNRFSTVYLADFCVLVYVSSNSGKAIDECNAMIQSMNSKITNDTWDEEDLGETTDSNIFFLLCYQENKN